MEKQIETVYVPTDEAPYLVVKDVEKEFIKARVTETKAYLYTPEEHAAVQEALLSEWAKGVKEGLKSVQGYRESLEKIAELCDNQNPTHADIWYIAHEHLCTTPPEALSKAEDKGEGKSAVDRAWTYLAKCKHITDKDLGDGFPAYNVLRALQMVAKEQPTNSLDKLESWVEESWSTQTMIWIHKDQLLSKIQSLKQPDVSDINVGNIPNNGWISVEDRSKEALKGSTFQNGYFYAAKEQQKMANESRCGQGLHFPIKDGTCILCGKPLPPKP